MLPYRPPRGRDATIDVLRGFCILSMTFGHLASGTSLSQPLHAFRWVDAAAGFIVLSGLVLGITNRAAHDRGRPLGGLARALLHRAWMIYLVHLVLVVYAVLLATALPERLEEDKYPRLGVEGVDVWTLLVDVPTLQLLPNHMPILPLYVCLLVLSTGALWLLQRRRGTELLLLACTALWLLSQFFPDLLRTDDGMNFRPALWQLPFFVAFALGWHWHRLRLWASARAQLGVLAAAVTATLAFAALANLTIETSLLGADVRDAALALVGEKYRVRPATLLFIASALISVYAGLLVVRRVPLLDRLLRPLRDTGSRSLDAYVVLSFATPVVLALQASAVQAQLAALLTFGACWAYVRLRARQQAPPADAPAAPRDATQLS